MSYTQRRRYNGRHRVLIYWRIIRLIRCRLLHWHGHIHPLPGWTHLGTCDWCGDIRPLDT